MHLVLAEGPGDSSWLLAMWSWKRWQPTDRNMSGKAGKQTSEHSGSFPCPQHPMLMGFLLLSFPPMKSFHLASLCSCSSPALSSYLSLFSIWNIPDYVQITPPFLKEHGMDSSVFCHHPHDLTFSLYFSYYSPSCSCHSLGKQYIYIYIYTHTHT